MYRCIILCACLRFRTNSTQATWSADLCALSVWELAAQNLVRKNNLLAQPTLLRRPRLFLGLTLRTLRRNPDSRRFWIDPGPVEIYILVAASCGHCLQQRQLPLLAKTISVEFTEILPPNVFLGFCAQTAYGGEKQVEPDASSPIRGDLQTKCMNRRYLSINTRYNTRYKYRQKASERPPNTPRKDNEIKKTNPKTSSCTTTVVV